MLFGFILTYCISRGCFQKEEINLNTTLCICVKMSFISLWAKLEPCYGTKMGHLVCQKSSMSVPVLAELHTRLSETSSLGTCGLCAPQSLSASDRPMCCSPRAHQRAGQELSKAPVVSKQPHSYQFAVASPYITEGYLSTREWSDLSRSSWTGYSRTHSSFSCSAYLQAIPPPTAGPDVGQDLVHNALVLRCQILIIQLGSNAMSYPKGLMILSCKQWHVEAVEGVICILKKYIRPASWFLN